MPFALARPFKYVMGSAPGDNTKMIGVVFYESLNAPIKSNGGLSINFSPRVFFVNSLIPDMSFSSLSTFRIINFWKGVHLSSKADGSGMK